MQPSAHRPLDETSNQVKLFGGAGWGRGRGRLIAHSQNPSAFPSVDVGESSPAGVRASGGGRVLFPPLWSFPSSLCRGFFRVSAHQPLPAAHCLPPTAHRPLPATHCPPPRAASGRGAIEILELLDGIDASEIEHTAAELQPLILESLLLQSGEAS